MGEPVNPDAAQSAGVLPTLPSFEDTSPSFEDTLPGCILLLSGGAELTVWPFMLGVLGCGCAGYWIGAEHFPGTGAEYGLAALGGLLGIFVGFALAGAAVGALVGWGIGWCLWSATKWLFGVDSDPLFWWPIYGGAGLGGLVGFCVAVWSVVNTVQWWRHRRARRKSAEPF